MCLMCFLSFVNFITTIQFVLLQNMVETVSQLKNTQKNKSKKLRVDTSPISTDAFNVMMEEYMNSGIQSALLTVLPVSGLQQKLHPFAIESYSTKSALQNFHKSLTRKTS